MVLQGSQSAAASLASSQPNSEASTLSEKYPIDYPIDEQFYLEDIFLLVEGYLYKLPKRTFAENSEMFRDMFSVPQPSGQVIEGSCKQHPINLYQIRRGDFNALLKVLFPIDPTSKDNLTDSEWESVLTLSCQWLMPRIKTKAIQQLGNYYERNPVQALAFSLKHDILEWKVPSLSALAQRPERIDVADAEILGLECAFKVCALREKAIDIVERHGQVYNAARNLMITPRRATLDFTPFIPELFG